MRNPYFKLSILIAAFCLVTTAAWATGEPSTYFNIFVPPNNDAVQRNVCLVVTAILDSTAFTITDDGMDGDTDDSVTGILMAGQSYILYIKDNGINDDAKYASGGVLKQDGDYFIIHADKNVYASQSTNSDWQHDWVPGVSQSSLSQKFIVYAPKVSSSKRDLNVFAYEDSTLVTLKRISLSATIQTGYTNVDYQGGTLIFQRLIHRGQDLIHFYNDARNIMDDGCTYIIETSKPATLQYGALFGNERDGGGYVPTNTGSCSGELAYFAVPYQAAGEQEIRVVSWDPANTVKLYRYNAGTWVLMQTWNMGSKTVAEWVGRSNGNASYSTAFKIECTAGKRVSIFEGNWFETGSPGTSDMATMMSAENGTTAGDYFLAYMAPPGNEASVLNPFTGTAFGGRYTHLYLFSQDTAHVTVKDAYTNGTDFTRTYTILPERYVDCALSETEWKSIYNGTGTTAGGPERPYLIVSSDSPISVMNTNFNDNWMMYFGSSQFRSFNQTTGSTSSTVIPGQNVTLTSTIQIEGNRPVTEVSAQLVIDGGLQVVSSTFNSNGTSYAGDITQNESLVIIDYNNLPNLTPNGSYGTTTVLKGSVMDADGNPLFTNNVSDMTFIVNGKVNGVPQQSTNIESVVLNTRNTSNLIFNLAELTGLETALTDSWTVSTIDYDNDGDDDLFFTDRNATQPNKLYRNNGNVTFTPITTGALVTDLAKSMASAWADCDNDGDLDVVIANNTQKPCFFYTNNGNGTFTKNTTAGFTQEVGYYHHVSWVDVDNDGQLELYLGNYWPTRFNELWRRNADGTWALWESSLLSQIPGSATGSTWADYDNDGFQDLIILNNEGGNNSLYHNRGNGNFEAVSNTITQYGGHSVGSTWGDIDKDGDLDLFISNASNYDNDLFINGGRSANYAFTRATGETVTDKGHSHGAAFADVDKDGDLDLYVANDQGVKFLYMNDGSGNFSKKTDEWPNSNFGNAYGTSFSDLDMDGDLDLVSATHSNQRNYIFTANNNSNAWINIRLVGVNSNKSAIGARVRVKSGGKWQCREVNAQNGLGGQCSYRQHFGLGTSSTIDSIEVKWPSAYVQRLANVNINQNLLITEENGTAITALAYEDANGNCAYDIGELALNNIKFKINNGDYIAYSDAEGKATLNLAVGNYTIAVDNNQYTAACSNPSSFNVQGVGGTLNVGNFGLRAACNNPNLAVSASTPIMRTGFPSQYWITANNPGLATANNVELVVTLPATIDILSASTPWTSLVTNNNQHTITWALGSLVHGAEQIIALNYRVTTALTPGNNVVGTFTVAGTESDCNASDNTFTDYQSIYGSVDPNDLLGFPVGENEEHYISNKQDITYRVRFQNVGNYPAEFVNIIDTLPEGLDASSLRNVSASHAFNMSSKGNIITFHFPNIQLPDSTSDLEGSNGYVQFTLDQRANNAGGIVIENTAAIQFDYNEFIWTNQIFHTVLGENNLIPSGELVIFPNPASDFCLIMAKVADGNAPALKSLSIYTPEGTLISNKQFNTNIPKLDLSDLNSGLYILSATDINGTIYNNKLIVTH